MHIGVLFNVLRAVRITELQKWQATVRTWTLNKMLLKVSFF